MRAIALQERWIEAESNSRLSQLAESWTFALKEAFSDEGIALSSTWSSNAAAPAMICSSIPATLHRPFLQQGRTLILPGGKTQCRSLAARKILRPPISSWQCHRVSRSQGCSPTDQPSPTGTARPSAECICATGHRLPICLSSDRAILTAPSIHPSGSPISLFL